MLFWGRLAAAFPRVNQLGVLVGERQNFFTDERVVNHCIRRVEGMKCKDRHEPRVARTGTGEPYPARLEIWKIGNASKHVINVYRAISPR